MWGNDLVIDPEQVNLEQKGFLEIRFMTCLLTTAVIDSLASSIGNRHIYRQ